MTSIRLTRFSDLTTADWRVWLDIQQGSNVYESPYFRPEFAQAVAAVREDAEVAVLAHERGTVGFFPFQRGKLNLGKPIGGKLSDYHGPLIRLGVEFDPLELLHACRLSAWDFDHLVTATRALAPYIALRDESPQMDLTEGFEPYVRRRREAGSDTVHRQQKKTRRLARDVGPLDFTFDAVSDDEAFALLQSWKSAQYKQTGLANVFSFPWTIALLRRLREFRGNQFAAPFSVLRAGGKVAAVMLSLRSRGVLHTWFNAYNPELATYSPGLALFVLLAEEAPSLGVCKIDLGRGGEPYKRSLATGSAMLGEGSISCPSLATWLRGRWRYARDWMQNSPLKETFRHPVKLIKPIREWLAYH